MMASEAQKIGSTKSIKATLITIGVALLFLLLEETQGDFANGILFFFDDVFNGFFLLLLGSLLVLSFWLGRIAGKAILQKKRPFGLMGLCMAAVTALYIILYISAFSYYNNGHDVTGTFQKRIKYYIIGTMEGVGAQVLLLQTFCWLWISYAIKQTAKTMQSQGQPASEP